MIDLLAVSTASVTAINRNIYVQLMKTGCNVEMVIAREYPVTKTKTLSAEGRRERDPVIHFLTLRGGNPRSFFFPDIENIVRDRRPRFILLENDPVSYMAGHVGKIAKRYEARLLCLSCENLSFDIRKTYQRRGFKSIPASLLKKYFYQSAKRYIDTVFTINEDGTKLFKEKGISQVIKIPLGFDENIFYPNKEKRNKIRAKVNITAPVIAYIGRMVEEKGVHILLKSLSLLLDLEWHFMLDKFTTYTNSYQQRIIDMINTYNLNDRVIYIEADHTEIADYMNAADVVVVPSLSTGKWKEQYGRVAPEAMACGALVIASRSGALPELVQDGGVLFQEGDIDELSLILRKFLEKPDLFDDIRTRGIEVARNLSLKSQAAQYRELIMS